MKDAIVDGYVMCDDGRSSVLMDYRMEDISYGTRRRYADIMIDRGFKIVFGSPANKDLLISLLECLIPECRIADIRFLDKEVPGFTMQDKKTIFDLNCRAPDGKTFVVEMQLGQQTYFCDRALFYSTYPIREQLLSSGEGSGDGPARGYRLNPVYVVSIVNFCLPHESASVLREGLVSSYSLRSDRGNELMTDALHFVRVFRTGGKNGTNAGRCWRSWLLPSGTSVIWRTGRLSSARVCFSGCLRQRSWPG